jgi:hypothetical protein
MKAALAGMAFLGVAAIANGDKTVQLVNGRVMYRGARSGNPANLTGPSYFSSIEIFAKTYGPTAPFGLMVRNPLVVSDSEWTKYATIGNLVTVFSVVRRLKSKGYDSVVNVRPTPGGDPLITVFLVDPKLAIPATIGERL